MRTGTCIWIRFICVPGIWIRIRRYYCAPVSGSGSEDIYAYPVSGSVSEDIYAYRYLVDPVPKIFMPTGIWWIRFQRYLCVPVSGSGSGSKDMYAYRYLDPAT